VHPQQLLSGDQRRLPVPQPWLDTGGDELVVDRGQALGALRMPRGRAVQRAIRMGDEEGFHVGNPWQRGPRCEPVLGPRPDRFIDY
jgi:hypothetical protein